VELLAGEVSAAFPGAGDDVPLKLVLVIFLVIQFEFPVRVRTLAEVLGVDVETTVALCLFNLFLAVTE
jgi:hypothetical protein